MKQKQHKTEAKGRRDRETRGVSSFLRFVFCMALLGACTHAPMHSCTPSAMAQDQPAVSQAPLAMWVWEFRIARVAEARNTLFDFCEKNGIGLLYFAAFSVTGPDEADYRVLNREAHARHIQIHALNGDPRWGLLPYHQRTMDWITQIHDFNRRVAATERFDGVHLDVEPYALGKPWEEKHAFILAQWLEMNQKAKTAVSAMHYGLDIPFWYDDDPTMSIPWRGVTKPASFHALDHADSIAVMDYRNFTQGDNGSIRLVRNEMEYAEAIGKRVWVGQETQAELEPSYVTFAEVGWKVMQEEMAKIVQAYSHSPAFAGIAVHHYVSFKKLLKRAGAWT